MKINCGNCGETLAVDLDRGTVTYNRPGSGRGSKRTPASVIVNTVWTEDEYLFCWDAPCCVLDGEAYADSIEDSTSTRMGVSRNDRYAHGVCARSVG